ncbi:MAG: prepilin peptidase [Candidatus Vogelbacteria bacterium]|nr:prepilin peptidase [Candidatus Vogelbacteria bacterium]
MIDLGSVLVFLSGLLIGSFLNVIIFRLNTGEGIGGRSKCGSCATMLRWFELIPVASFLAQRGRCRTCLARLSRQYIAVEGLTAIIFLLVYLREETIEMAVFYWLVFSFLVVISAYDLRHTIIPEQFSYSLIALGVVYQIYNPSFMGILTGVSLFSFFASMWWFSSGKWMGFGDAKLVLGIVWVLPPTQAIVGAIFAFWIGAIVGIFLLFLKAKRFTLKSEIPFAPFLASGAFLAYILEIQLPLIGA